MGNWLNFLKFNYSFGIVGSDEGPRFQYAQVFNRTGAPARFGFDNLTPFGPGYVEGNPANPNSTWETSTKQNIAIKADVFDRLSFSLDLFDEKREGILMARRTQPSFYGTDGVATGNIDETKNRGYELEWGWQERVSTDFE